MQILKEDLEGADSAFFFNLYFNDLIFYTSLYNLNTKSDTLIPSLRAIIYNEMQQKVIVRKEF